MSKPIEELPNLGPATARMLARIGVVDERGLAELGPVEAYARMRFISTRGLSLNALYSMDAALRGESWRNVSSVRKAELRRALAERGR